MNSSDPPLKSSKLVAIERFCGCTVNKESSRPDSSYLYRGWLTQKLHTACHRSWNLPGKFRGQADQAKPGSVKTGLSKELWTLISFQWILMAGRCYLSQNLEPTEALWRLARLVLQLTPPPPPGASIADFKVPCLTQQSLTSTL